MESRMEKKEKIDKVEEIREKMKEIEEGYRSMSIVEEMNKD